MMPLYMVIVLLSEIFQVAAVNKISSIHQDRGLKTARVGYEVTLHCTYQDDTVNFLSWYKQSLGGKPDIISTRMKLNPEATISSAYKERFRVIAKKGINHLVIRDIQLSDSATYYCGILEFNAIEFGEGVFLQVKSSSSNITAVVHQPALELLRAGDSVNLSCTIYTEPCAGEQSFYWFRHGAAQPAVMYHSKGQCEADSESHMKSCILNLAVKSVSSADAGMYYCALASCGETVFGNGTRVQIEGGSASPRLLVYCLSVALAVSIIVLLVLAFILHRKESCSVCKGTVSHSACSATPDAVGQSADALHYAALSLNRTRERHRKEGSTEAECLYSKVKSRKE
ncbi:uncharacterized protein LOC117807117 [Notolabrus celidotus]|uniref:uncharacterized protein LOC117807117 n=1 Tax=Notolabrus celidotus TaxID=1203425 RepID=UPI00148FF2A8|nr:uncharacterized protein LOC117807117 [Notolabrus celidotus]